MQFLHVVIVIIYNKVTMQLIQRKTGSSREVLQRAGILISRILLTDTNLVLLLLNLRRFLNQKSKIVRFHTGHHQSIQGFTETLFIVNFEVQINIPFSIEALFSARYCEGQSID